MSESISISAALHLSEVNESEIRWLLQDFFHSAFYDDSEGGKVYYPDRTRASVILLYSGESLMEAIPGAKLTPSEVIAIQQRIEAEILAPARKRVGMDIYLSEKPVVGYFRHRDDFQISPAPASAPRPDLRLPGLYPRHPFVLEYSFDASSHAVLSGLRRLKKRREMELILGALLDGSILHLPSTPGRYRWVLKPLGVPAERLRSSFLPEGYICEGFPAESNQFSELVGSNELPAIEPSEYYQLFWGPAMTLALPKDFSLQLVRFSGLPIQERGKFLRACHWLRESNAALWSSRSAAFVALVIAVEALMPSTRAYRRKSFEAFIDRFAPGRGLEQDRKRFYQIRSELTHGTALRHDDRDSLEVSISPEMSDEFREFDSMRRVARSVIVNWLAAN
jgi:hypothetical protein